MDHHHHHYSVPHNSGHNFLNANKEYFDNLGQQFDQVPGAISLAQSCARAMLNAYVFKEGETVVMDYACGTGLISKELIPHVKSILGVDISQGMVNQFNLRVQNESISPDKMHAVREELEGKEGELDGMKFDVIVCASAYHHFESIEHVTKCLVYFLNPGGSLLVVDFEKADRDRLEDKHRAVVPHAMGISEAKIRSAFEDAGLTSLTYQSAFGMEWKGIPTTHFIAAGVKPA
jgi:ubiquinone/menaquinone biosynthesis C-methylase UbiE